MCGVQYNPASVGHARKPERLDSCGCIQSLSRCLAYFTRAARVESASGTKRDFPNLLCRIDKIPLLRSTSDLSKARASPGGGL